MGANQSDQKIEFEKRLDQLAINWKGKEEKCSQLQEKYINCINSNPYLNLFVCRKEREMVAIAENQAQRAAILFERGLHGTTFVFAPNNWKY